MKLSDDQFDDNNNLPLAIIFGVFCAIASAIATVNNVGAAYIFVGILIGNLLAFKIDGIHHLITLVIYIIISVIGGFPELNIVILLVCILAALSDEVGHELSPNTQNTFIHNFFEYRFLMKIVMLLLVFFGVFGFEIFIFFILFEVAYLMAGKLVKN